VALVGRNKNDWTPYTGTSRGRLKAAWVSRRHHDRDARPGINRGDPRAIRPDSTCWQYAPAGLGRA